MRSLTLLTLVLVMSMNAGASTTWNLTAIADSTVDAKNPDTTGASGDLLVQRNGVDGAAGPTTVALKNAYVQFQLPQGVTGSNLQNQDISANITLQQKSGNAGLLLYAFMVKDGLDTASADTYTWNQGIGFDPANQAAVMDYHHYYDPAKADWFGAMSTYGPGPINMYYTSNFADLIKADTDGRITVFFAMYQPWNYQKQFASIEDGTLAGPVLTITGVPEPASLVLLGLGGLFLKRRNK